MASCSSRSLPSFGICAPDSQPWRMITACSIQPIKQQRQQASSSRRMPGLESPLIGRRHLAGDLVSLLALITIPATAKGLESTESAVEYKLYNSEIDKYSLRIPSDWVQGEGKATNQRNVTAFFPADDASANVDILITGLGADYTGLGSFGTVDAFAENLVNSLDRSWKKPPGQAAKLINCQSKNGFYYVEYTVQQPGKKKRHLLSAVGICFNGWYNRLYTVTGQCWEDDKERYGPLLEKVVDSFKFV